MKTLKFNTNIKCNGCISAVKPYLDKAAYIESWSVDLASPNRILTVKTTEPPQKITDLLKEAGYNGTLVGNS